MGQSAEPLLSDLGVQHSARAASVARPGEAKSGRYSLGVRAVAGVVVGVLASILIITSIQVGAGIAFHEDTRDWSPLMWGQHWAWRAAWGLVATYFAGFLGGLVSRDRGTLVGVLGALPSAAFWALVAYSGWTGHFPNGGAVDIPIGYRLAATLVALATLPLAAMAGTVGAEYGAANATHFDSRRATLFGIKWYQYLWLPILLHLLIVQATWAAMYSFGWLVASWQSGFSFFFSIPAMFMMAMLGTWHLMGLGAFRAYEALAGFDSDDNRSTAKRVLLYGFGYPLAAAVAQSAISLVQYGLTKLFS
jgi:hypothetical protein